MARELPEPTQMPSTPFLAGDRSFRRLAICVLALPLLAACGGGGSSSGIGAPGTVFVLPQEDFDCAGEVGGPFVPSSRTYTIHNDSDADVSWTVTSNQNWVDITDVAGNSDGVVPAGGSVLVTVAVDAAQAALLGPGSYTGRLRFLETGGAPWSEFLARIVVTDTTSDGWTELAPSVDSRLVYVSSTGGNDANDGLSELTPKASISAGLALMRHGFPDWLMLKKGDVFGSSDVPSTGYKWITSGRSETEPTVWTSYGPANGARPRIETAGKPAIRTSGGGGSPAVLEHIAFVGLDLDALPRDAVTQNPNGIRLLLEMHDVLIEDCRIAHFGNGLTAQLTGGMLTQVRIRRNVVTDSYTGDGSHGQSIYCDEVTGLLIEENVIDHGGWSELDPNANGPTIFKHNVYIQGDARDVVFRGNIVTNASSHGVQLRSGGVANDNVFIKNPVALLLAGNGEARGNLVLDGRDITPSLPRRQGIHVQNVDTGAIITHNIVANSSPGSGSKAIVIQVLNDAGSLYGVRNLLLDHNVVHGWGGETLDIQSFAGTFFENFVVQANDFQNSVDAQELVQHQSAGTISATTGAGNRYFSATAAPGAWVNVANTATALVDYLASIGDTTSSATAGVYPDPNATIADYHASIGGAASYDAFIAEALLQSRANWRSGYTAAAILQYFRDGFGVPAY